MPTGALRQGSGQALAEWRHLTHWVLTQLSVLVSFAPDFSIPQSVLFATHHTTDEIPVHQRCFAPLEMTNIEVTA